MAITRVGAVVVGILGIIVGIAITVGAERAGILGLVLRRAGIEAPRPLYQEALARSREAGLEGELAAATRKAEEAAKTVADLRIALDGAEEARWTAERLSSEVGTLREERSRLEAELLVERERRRSIESWTAENASPAIPVPPAPLAVSVVASRPDLGIVVLDRGRSRGIAAGKEFALAPGSSGPRAARIVIDEVREETSIGQVVPASAAAEFRPGASLVERER